MDIKELRKKEKEELQKMIGEAEGQLTEASFAIKTAEETDISKLKKLRKKIARIRTILREKQINLEIKRINISHLKTKAVSQLFRFGLIHRH